MRILLLGAGGQVGWELQRALTPLGDVTALTRAEADFTDLHRLRETVRAAKADIVVNAAAYTAVDKAESEAAQAALVNAKAVGVLAEEAHRNRALLVHYSTDYIFDGTKPDAYVETDAPNPISVYGATKLQGEEAVRITGVDHLIFRTSWVYATRGKNFPRTILAAAQTRDELKVVADQIGAPTSAELIADVTALALHRISADRRGLTGTYHLTAAGETSWHAYAQHLLRLAARRGYSLKANAERVMPVTTAEYSTLAKRIANSRLATDKLRTAFGLTLPFWGAQLERFLDELPHEGSPAR